MKSKAVTKIMLTLLFAGILTLTFNIQPVFQSSEIHDVAVVSLSVNKGYAESGYEFINGTVGRGYSPFVNTMVANQGDFTENFNVTVYANTTLIATWPPWEPQLPANVTLTSGNSTSLTFYWDTWNVPYGYYTISAYATQIEGELDTSNNFYSVVGWVLVTIPGDIDGDRDVDVGDQRKMQLPFTFCFCWPPLNPNGDIDCDGDVDIADQRKQQLHMFQSW